MTSRGRKHKRQAFRDTADALGMSPRMLRRLRYTMPVGVGSVFPTESSAKILQRMRDARESVRSHIQEAYCNPLLQAWAQEAQTKYGSSVGMRANAMVVDGTITKLDIVSCDLIDPRLQGAH